jgi:hypothetical protein
VTSIGNEKSTVVVLPLPLQPLDVLQKLTSTTVKSAA